MAINDTLASLISDPKWKAFEEIIKEEIAQSERNALKSIMSDAPDKESAYRAKFLAEALAIPENRIKASKMNS